MFFMFLYRMFDEISLILHHNGKFIQNENEALEYVGGEFCIWEEVETYLVNVWTPQELCKACCNYEKFISVCYLVSGIGLQRLTNDHDVLSMCQTGLTDPKKEAHVYLENVDPEGGPVNEIGSVIEVHVMLINCNAENVAEVVAEKCTHNGIEDMDVDGAKGGSDDENEVVGTGVPDAETEVVETKPEVARVEIEVNNGADNDEVKIMYPQYNPTSSFGEVHLEVGMEFDTIKMFIEVVRDYTIFRSEMGKN